MGERIVFHGSFVAVPKPEIRTDGFAKDFGYGFYCTAFEKQARRWAIGKRDGHFVSSYACGDFSGLAVKTFEKMSDEWLDFVVSCRRGGMHAYDIVEGPMADDTIWNFVEDFIEGRISRAAFWELVKFKYPTHQIVFCTPAALGRISFNGSYTL